MAVHRVEHCLFCFKQKLSELGLFYSIILSFKLYQSFACQFCYGFANF